LAFKKTYLSMRKPTGFSSKTFRIYGAMVYPLRMAIGAGFKEGILSHARTKSFHQRCSMETFN
jgi:hypothetical protein